ncbi:MAG: PTS transporter subunit EIIA [Gammaproteobacteria bacterium]|nr:PTS transporter subunit EIIA [Gammaproteobacteria bacterium]
MFPAHFLIAGRIVCQSKAASKKRVLEELGGLLASSIPKMDAQRIVNKLLERERLGSTGLGQGIALPHARIPGIDNALGAFIQLQEGIQFDAIDNQPVDLAFGLIVPEQATQEHLDLLAKLATLFGNMAFCNKLRQIKSEELILAQLTSVR